MQKGFRLVVGVVCKENPVGRLGRQGFMAYFACRSFEPLARPCRDLDAENRDRDAKAVADFRTGIGPSVGVTAKTVMNMQRRKPQARVTNQAACRVQQYRGIQSAGKAHDD